VVPIAQTVVARTPRVADGPRILVIDDDCAIRALVSRALEAEQFRVEEAATGPDGIEAIRSRPPDLVVLDLGLPGVSGLEVLRELRRTSDLPALVLSGRGGEADRVAALEVGADDYVVKPFFARELAARVRCLLRRARGPSSTRDRLTFSELVIDVAAREVLVRGSVVGLTRKEFDLLVHLASAPRRAVGREELLRLVWRSSSEWQDPDTVTEHVRRLRQKIEPNPRQPTWIRTVRGIGYRFEPEP
jgi:two-component system phosphate regulon response regulator PhoB